MRCCWRDGIPAAPVAATSARSPHTTPSYPAQAGYPVRRALSIPSLTPVQYWIVRRSLSFGGAKAPARWRTMTTGYDFAISRHDLARGLRFVVPRNKRGSRECRVRAAPAVSCAKGNKQKRTRAYRSAEAIRHSLRNGFTAYSALSLATNSSCHHRWRINGLSAPGRADMPPPT